jgi:hypothetical protein
MGEATVLLELIANLVNLATSSPPSPSVPEARARLAGAMIHSEAPGTDGGMMLADAETLVAAVIFGDIARPAVAAATQRAAQYRAVAAALLDGSLLPTEPVAIQLASQVAAVKDQFAADVFHELFDEAHALDPVHFPVALRSATPRGWAQFQQNPHVRAALAKKIKSPASTRAAANSYYEKSAAILGIDPSRADRPARLQFIETHYAAAISMYQDTLLGVVERGTNLDKPKHRNAIYDMQILALTLANNEVQGKPIVIVTGDAKMQAAAAVGAGTTLIGLAQYLTLIGA